MGRLQTRTLNSISYSHSVQHWRHFILNIWYIYNLLYTLLLLDVYSLIDIRVNSSHFQSFFFFFYYFNPWHGNADRWLTSRRVSAPDISSKFIVLYIICASHPASRISCWRRRRISRRKWGGGGGESCWHDVRLYIYKWNETTYIIYKKKKGEKLNTE